MKSTMSARAYRLCVFGLSLGVAACVDQRAELVGVTTQPIVEVQHTDVKRQSIGNCWLYATVSWAESLHLSYTGESLDLSESYLSYWHWYEQIVGSANVEEQIASLEDGEISTGGVFGVAGELMLRYGVVEEGSFIEAEAEKPRSARQRSALEAINESLEHGALKDPANRHDRALVRKVLDEAWELSSEVRETLDTVFGPDVSRTLYEDLTIPKGSGLMTPDSIPVGVDAKESSVELTLADAIGTPRFSDDFRARTGRYAWNVERMPYDPELHRDFFLRMQKALHRRLPVVIEWFVDFNAMDDEGSFRKVPESPHGQGGDHMTLVEDYEISNVPGYGTLRAGTVTTDPAALEAALAEEATIDFVRVKNSWGTDMPFPDFDVAGYLDIYYAYMTGSFKRCTEDDPDDCPSTTTGLLGFVLPPKTFSIEP